MSAGTDGDAITFAVLGHNEAALLANALGQATQAARPGDAVWFVDGASADGSGEAAAALGVEVLAAPLGKGRAIAAALSRCETPYVCFIDADIESSSANIPLSLRDALLEAPADMIVADFVWPERRMNVSITAVYRPLVAGLFPEPEAQFGDIPYSGFRILRADLPLGALPPGYGVESYMNLMAVARGWSTRMVWVGEYHGPVRRKPELGFEVAEAILDVAEAHGRLDAELRPAWEEWVAGVMEVVARQPDPGTEPGREFRDRVAAAAARPLPPARRV